MGKHAFQMKVVQLPELLRQAVQFTGQKTAASHPGIHAHMNVYGLVIQGAQGIEMLRLLHAGKGGAPAVLHNLLPFSGKTGPQNKRARLHARIPHPGGFRHGRDAEKGAPFVIQSFHHPLKTVAVSLRLHNGHLPLVRHDAANDT